MLDKKIIIFMPSIEGGGVEKNLFEICNFLSTKYKKVNLITVSNQYKNYFSKKIRLHGPKKFTFISNRIIKYIICSIYLFFELIKERSSKRVIFSFQGNIFAIIIAKIFNCKIVVRANSAPSGWVKNEFKKKIFKIMYNYSDKIIVNSNDFKNEFKKFFGANAVCIYNPLNKKKIIKLSKKKTIFFKKKSKIKILNIGRLVDQKNQIILLKALNIIKDHINFEVIIMGNGILKKKLEKYIKENQLQKRVKIIKFQKNPYNILNSCDTLIHTAKYEGLPNVLIEAQVLKKIIFSSDCPSGPREILINGKAGILFKNNNYIDLSKKFINLIRDKKYLNKKIEYGYKKLYRFDYYHCLEKYFSILNKV